MIKSPFIRFDTVLHFLGGYIGNKIRGLNQCHRGTGEVGERSYEEEEEIFEEVRHGCCCGQIVDLL